MPHPEIEAMSEHEQLRSAMQPVYPSTETLTNRGISNRVINKLMQQLFKKLKRCLQKPCLII
jgi:ATP-dependent DNA helicase RecG